MRIEYTETGNLWVNKDLPGQEVSTQMVIPLGDEEAYVRFGVREWLDAGNNISDYVGHSATELWENSMHYSDLTLPRYAEDILDGMDKSGVAQISLDRLQAKKDLRATKP
jgi:hypothetical protein